MATTTTPKDLAQLHPAAEYGGATSDQPTPSENKKNGERSTDATATSMRDATSVPQLELSSLKFGVMITTTVVVLVAVLAVFAHGVVIDTRVQDALGSSKNVDARIKWYQLINGYVTSGVGSLMEGYVTVFLMVTIAFLKNVRWFPGDEPRVGKSLVKRLCLVAFSPVILYVLNVAISAAFVSHTTTGVLRVFVDDDLFSSNTLSYVSINSSAAANLTSIGNNVSVLDTILGGAVRQMITPFKMLLDSPCVLVNASENVVPPTLPSVKEVGSTAVVYGFPTQDWNLDAMPFGLLPTHTVEFIMADINSTDDDIAARFTQFQKDANVSWLTTYELLFQGKLMFERSISDSNANATYPCAWVDGQYELDDTAGSGSGSNVNATATATAGASDVFEDGPYKGFRRCYGAVSSLQDLANITDPSMHTMKVLVDTIIYGFVATVPEIAPEEMDVAISTYTVNPQVKLTSMTIDIPYLNSTQYRNTSEYCVGDQLKAEFVPDDNSSTPEETEWLRAALCDQSKYPYEDPRSACGSSNCVFLDKSGTPSFKKQMQLMPYMKNCSTAHLKYSADLLNFFPTGCVPQEDAVFLYGLGTFMSGDEFTINGDDYVPVITHPRRHVVLSFAKLEWQMEDLSPKFEADCGVNATTHASRCVGLLHDLENVTVPALNVSTLKEKYMRVLILGKDNLPAARMSRDFRNPVQLISLNARPFYYKEANAYYEWEYVDKTRFTSTNWPATGGLTSEFCSPLVDSYITHVETNHFYIDRPLQPLYTSALFYLFQDAAVKTVKLTKNATTGADVLELSVVGTTSLKGDLEKHEIKFSIPLLSLLSTFAGLAFLLLLAVMAVVCPTERLKMSEETNVAVQYAHLLQTDQYPSEVIDRGIMLPSGERILMDEYVLDSLTLRHTENPDKEFFL